MKVDLTKDKFNNKEFINTVDIEFRELVKSKIKTTFDLNLATVGDFFLLYEKLFYDIPKDGATKSHEFLVGESGRYIGYEEENATITELSNQIVNLEQEVAVLTQAPVDVDKQKPDSTILANTRPKPGTGKPSTDSSVAASFVTAKPPAYEDANTLQTQRPPTGYDQFTTGQTPNENQFTTNTLPPLNTRPPSVPKEYLTQFSR